MHNGGNSIIKFGIIKSVVLLAFTGIIVVSLVEPIEGQMMGNPSYNYGYGPGMMGNPGYNYSYGSGMMGPGHNYSYGPGMGPGYNYSYGPGMMGSMIMGNMMALYNPVSKPITQDQALRIMENLSREYGSNMEIEDFIEFSGNYYAVVNNTANNQNIAEIVVDRYSGAAYPEPGPNMMWNTLYGAGRAPAGSTGYDLTGAQKLAEDFLTGYLPGAQITESKAMPGYYTFDFGRNNTEGMLSVNAFSGQVWVHTWNGYYLGGMSATS